MRFAKILSVAALPMFLFACSDDNASFATTAPESDKPEEQQPPLDSIPENEKEVKLTRDFSDVWSGSGTVEDPFLVTNEQQLASIEFYVSDSAMTFRDKYFKQTADIVLTKAWKPIGIFGKNAYGYGNRTFSGSYDGGSKTISGLTISDTASYSGLFGLTRGAHISNVVLKGAKMSVGSNAGVLAGKMDSTTVENCVLEDIEISGKDRVGGLVGEASNVSVANVAVSGIVKGENSVGGVVGRLQDGSFDNVVNKADVTGKSTVGGVAGAFATTTKNEAAAENVGFVRDLLNYGNVTGTSNVAGVIASLSSTKADHVGNYGAVTADEGAMSNVAGVFAETSNNSVVNEVFNAGKVSVKKAMATGGVFGSLKNSTAKNVFNQGELAGQASNLGGLAGIIDGQSNVESSYNAGTIPNENYAGTVAGSGKSTITLTNVFYDSTVGEGCQVFGGDAPFGIVIPTGVTTADMKAATFVATLNGAGSVWTIDPTKFNGYPSFSWIK